jgi:5'-deoxynucleotidase
MTVDGIFSLVSRLSGIQRFSMLKMCHPENVLEHVGMVCIFCYIITDWLNQVEPNIDIGKVLTRAVVHDFDETITGDVPRPTKYFSKELRASMTQLEMNGIANLARKLHLATLVMDHAVAKEHKEGAIVALADIMAAIHRVWEEVLIYNNHHFVEPAKGMREVLVNVREKSIGKFLPGQHYVIDVIIKDLDAVLTKVLQHPCELMELHNAN